MAEELAAQIDIELAKLGKLMVDDLPRFNDLLARKKVPGVFTGPVRPNP